LLIADVVQRDLASGRPEPEDTEAAAADSLKAIRDLAFPEQLGTRRELRGFLWCPSFLIR
jgi:hypothetical protein